MKAGTITAFLLGVVLSGAAAGEVGDLLDRYRAQGAADFSGERGMAMWTSTHWVKGEERACSSCHQAVLTSPGKHAKTGKPIASMAPSVNPERFTDAAKVEKWFKRNCKWTLGRECTPQEKGDILSWLSAQ